MNLGASSGARGRRALLAVALAAAAATSAVSSATAGAPAGRPEAAGRSSVACPGLPRGLALTGNGQRLVFRVTRAGSTPLASVGRGVITKAVRGRNGTMWIEVRRTGRPNGRWRRIVRVEADGSRRTSETGEVELAHVGALRGRTTVIYIDRDDLIDPYPERFGHVYVEFSTGARRSVTFAEEVVNVVQSAATAVHRGPSGRLTRVVVIGRAVDAPNDFTFHNLRGAEVGDFFDPNDGAPHFGPPSFAQPMLSPLGVRLAWAEGPDWSYERDRRVGDWKLVVADSRTGARSVRVKVGRLGEELHHADYDGRYWVGTFSPRMDRAPKPSELSVRIVDTWSANPRPVDAGCSVGFIASIDRFATNQPPTEES